MADPNTPEAEEQGAWGRPVSARLGEIFMAVALLATAGLFIWQSALLPFGRVTLPGPGFFPFMLGIALAVFAVAVLYIAVVDANAAAKVFLGHRDVLVVVLAMFGVAYAFERADSYLVLGVFVAVLLLVIAKTSVARILLGAVIGMALVWVIFRLGLGVRLPSSDYWDALQDLLARRLGGGR
jgi:putative tricarboxylic transport membrane protein